MLSVGGTVVAGVKLVCLAGAAGVELGCGTGYWASVLRTRGVRVAAFDARPPAREDLREDASRLDCSEDAAGNDNVLANERCPDQL